MENIVVMEEEDLPRKKDDFTPRVLDTMSIDQLSNYIEVLNEEMQRVRNEIAKKSTLMQEAESLFKN